ncbi:MAG: cyclic nucleotide-binding domain-containing protein [Planctomycetes bacterium]|nr:cyclic nucleotide-binding domain-containing protein [Planctomycetota bacterium]
MATAQEPVLELPRGGVVVTTSAGPLQFGCPPETIKDHMALGLTVPTHYVVPRERFDRSRGVNVSEVEFPAYFNFFVLKRTVNLITDEDGEARLRRILTETLFGPQGRYAGDAEFDASIAPAARPDHATECGQFRKNPFKPTERLEVDTLITFTRFDEAGVARVGDDVTVERLPGDQGYVVRDGGAERARVPARVRLPERERPSTEAPGAFHPPAFGVTVLGSSHGFDPKGKTTGFIVWINHRGLLVDPPMGSTDLLAQSGIAPKLIDGVILTHCHADHDSGTFQKVLEEGRVVLYTSPTILGSFLRKYSALSGLDEDFLRRLFIYRPVKIGSSVRVHGGELRFFYTLHSIPTVGFEAFYGGKSLVFSADTLYDPARIEDMVKAGTLTRERADALIRFPWHHTVVLHEAGVPPLHTPVPVLAALPPDVKRRLYLLHIAQKDLPDDQGLKVAPAGVENTLRIPVDPPRHAEAIALLDVFVGLDLFRGFSLARARELLQVARTREYPAGQRIIAQDSPGDAFYVIVSGVASVRRDGAELKRYQAGDFFGETALILGQPRNADVFAHTDCVLAEIDRYDFLYLLRGTDIAERLVRLANMREERSWELFARNSALQELTSAQKTQLQSFLEVVELKAGDLLWAAGAPAEAAFVVDQGRVALDGYGGSPLEPFGPGAFLGEVDALVQGRACAGAARAVEAGRAFRIKRADLARWFEENPGVRLAFLGTKAVE